MKNKLGNLLFILGIFPGLFFLGFTIYGYAKILNCYGTPGCSELLMIPAVSSIFGFPSWLGVTVGLNLMQKRFDTYWNFVTYTITFSMGGILFYFLFVD